jgi:pilus assembly protein CpaF
MPSFLETLKGGAGAGAAHSKEGASDDLLIRARSEKAAPFRKEGRSTPALRGKEPTKILLTDRDPSSEGLLAELMGIRSEQDAAGKTAGVRVSETEQPNWLITPLAKQKNVGMLLDSARTSLCENESEWSDEELPSLAKKVVERAARSMPTELRVGAREINEATTELVDLLVGFGPCKELVTDPHVTDICIDSYDRISCIRSGRAIETPFAFRSRQDLRTFVARITRLLGRNVSIEHPIVEGMVQLSSQVDTRTRVQCVHGSLRGVEDPALILRIQRFPFVSLYDLLKTQTLPAPVAAFLSEVVTFRESTIVIVGPPCSGKTTLAAALLGAVGSDERVALVEYMPELQLSSCQTERFTLMRDKANTQPRSCGYDLAAYLYHAPIHRMVFGEMRPDDAELFVQVLESGRKGALATMSAPSSWSALDSLSYALSRQMSSSVDVAKTRLFEQIDLLLVTRIENGRPCLVELSEVVRERGEIVPLIQYEGESKGKRFWRMTGEKTPLVRRLAERGVELMTSPQCLPPLVRDNCSEELDGAT